MENALSGPYNIAHLGTSGLYICPYAIVEGGRPLVCWTNVKTTVVDGFPNCSQLILDRQDMMADEKRLWGSA